MIKSKILLISQNFYPEIGSAANRANNLFQLLQREGYEVSVLTTEPSYPNKNLYKQRKFWDDETLTNARNINRIKVRNIKYALSIFNRLLFYIEMALRMLGYILIDKQKYDAIIVTSPPIFVGFVGIFAKLKYKTKFILDIRDLWPESLKGVGVFNYQIIIRFFSFLETLLYKSADLIIINSFGFRNYIVNKTNIDKNKIIFIPNAARNTEIMSVHEKSGQFRVIYTGNIGLAQDVQFLKDLVEKLDRQHIAITIVGYGQKKVELVRFIKDHNLQNVTMIKPSTREECLKLNAEHDIGLLTLNNSEVFDTVLPGKLIDYMMSGIPVVAAVSGYSKEIIESYETGFVTEMRDANEILDYIIRLKDNNNLRKKTAKNGLALITDEFLWEKNIKKLTRIFEERFHLK